MNQTLYAAAAPANTTAVITDADLPLQRIYLSEQQRASSTLFTQPWQGQPQSWTWAEAMQETRRIAAWLQAQNYPSGSRIAIMAKNCAWWIMADFAIWMSGNISVPIFPTVQDSSLFAIFDQSKPVACFLGSVEHLPALDHPCFQNMQWIAFPHSERDGMASWSSIVEQTSPLSTDPTYPADSIASIIYTSGTTGQPKGVLHTFRSFALMSIAVKRALGRPGAENDAVGDRMLSYLPLAHIAERAIVEGSSYLLPLHIFFTEGQSTFLADLQRARATVFFTIPRLLIRFQQGVLEKLPQNKLNLILRVPILNSIVRKKILRELGLGHTRLAASGAAPLPASVIDWYHRLGLNLIEGYGMTETGITHVPFPGRDRVGYVGEACEFALTRISDSGEIQIKGPMNFAGYYLNPDATAACYTSDSFFRTGDRGEIDEVGRLKIIGRLKEEFKTSKGKYVIPAQIETALSLCQRFESVCVLGSGMTSPFAIAVLTPEVRNTCNTADEKRAIEQLLEQDMESVNALHEHHEHLRFLVIDPRPWTTDNGLLTPTLKVRRTLIETRYGNAFESWENQKKKIIWLEQA